MLLNLKSKQLRKSRKEEGRRIKTTHRNATNKPLILTKQINMLCLCASKQTQGDGVELTGDDESIRFVEPRERSNGEPVL